MSERIRIFVWATDTAGCFYQRLKLPLDALVAKYPDEFEVCWSCEPTRALSDPRPNVVIGQRIMGNGTEPDPTWLEMCQSSNLFAVYEIDDDIIDLDPGNTVPYQIFTPNREGTSVNIALADAVIVSTPNLANKIRRDHRWIIDRREVTVAPNCIADGSVIERDGSREGRDHVTIGWAGSMFHQQDFTPELVAQLAAVRDHFGDRVRWVSIGANYLGWGSTFAWGPINVYHNRLEFIDIGIAPIARTPFNASKSWIKALDYMSKGVVPIVEDWGQYPDLVGSDARGEIVPLADDWEGRLIASVEDLQHDAFDHHAIAERAREFQISNQIDLWADVFRKAREL